MDYIKGHCRTNLDDYQTFVYQFYRVPNVGEKVACMLKGYETSLKVCQVIHTLDKGEPYIIVELTK